MRRARLFIVWLFIGCGGTHPTRAFSWHEDAQPVILITLPDASGTFHFSVCGAPTISPDVRRIGVYPAGQRLTRPIEVACAWAVGDGVRLSEWKYASQSQGSHLSGACRPLNVGKTYEVFVSGLGVSHMIFKVDEIGGVLVGSELGSQCPAGRE